MIINRLKKKLIDWCKYALLLACLFKVIVSGLGPCLFSYHNNSICVDIMQMEAEDTDYKDDPPKKDVSVICYDNHMHLNLPKKWIHAILFNSAFDKEAVIQFFYPHVPTPPPNC